MLAIQLSHKEQELQEVLFEIRKLEALINSPKVPQGRYRNIKIDDLKRLAKKRDKLTNEITEKSLLNL